MAQTWESWTLTALAGAERGGLGDDREVIEEVAARFADRFGPTDRVYHDGTPAWQLGVRTALTDLEARGLVRRTKRKAGPWLTLLPAGREEAGRPEAEPAHDEPLEESTNRPPLLMPGVIAPALRSPASRERAGFPVADDEPGSITVELNLRYGRGVNDAFARLTDLWHRVVRFSSSPDRTLKRLGDEYATGYLSMDEMKRLVTVDAVPSHWPERCMYRLWPNFRVVPHVDSSCVTVKADAARRAFNALGARIVWAVIDSGIAAEHPHFEQYETLSHESVRGLHRFFPLDGEPDPDPALALTDETGHGTHVAGIIAGALQGWHEGAPDRKYIVTESRYNAAQPNEPLRLQRDVGDLSLLAGMAPKTRLVSLKVLQPLGTADSRVDCLIRALRYVRQVNGDGTDGMRIHGVNLSLGYEFNPEWFACGQSPLCNEVNKLVRAGVVVVVSAGNSGYGKLGVIGDAPNTFGLAMTINDPGNAELAITVGSTHRSSPHAYGVSYFSSKGPTGDGRAKPDLVAPGERITSCAAGAALTSVVGDHAPPRTAVYVEDTGTSMAAPHVSGAAAALLSVRREFIGRPDRVKQILCDSAIPLGRTPAFEGAGLLDLMRALQIV